MDIDTPTLKTIVTLQLKEIEELAGKAKGKQREDTITDSQFALNMYANDLLTVENALIHYKKHIDLDELQQEEAQKARVMANEQQRQSELDHLMAAALQWQMMYTDNNDAEPGLYRKADVDHLEDTEKGHVSYRRTHHHHVESQRDCSIHCSRFVGQTMSSGQRAIQICVIIRNWT
ncbi:hypothetical protein M433DRAFT_199961 [Acidomyces richmondensis BFW]|nr:MAG: hypothetical protein FE78DRAFT_268946 [Acidomyces sp. 'richmondensis']KYG46472.1 hypothetical protein M433DRAFT_199961 [Acidomyces richmondensis BFW]